jgi:acyl-CoA thioesterase
VTGHPLDTDTALEQITPGRWRGEIVDRWWVVRGPFGGYVSTFLTRAMVAAVGDPARRPRSLTVHFIEPPAAGPVEVTATVERTGRSTSAVSLRLIQEGRPVAIALGTCGVWRDAEPEWDDAQPPPAPPPEECPPIPRTDGGPRFFDLLDVRWVEGGTFGRPSPEARNVAWLRPRPARALDHLALTALSDHWMPAAFSRLGRLVSTPTLDLTIHFRSAVAATGDWVLAVGSSRLASGGVWEEDGELWSADGELLTQSRQLALIRELP